MDIISSRVIINEVSGTPDIDDSFLDDELMNLAVVDENPWFADIANYLASGVVPTGLTIHYSKKFFNDLRYYYWDNSLLRKSCADNMLRLYILEVEIHSIIKYYYYIPCGGICNCI